MKLTFCLLAVALISSGCAAQPTDRTAQVTPSTSTLSFSDYAAMERTNVPEFGKYTDTELAQFGRRVCSLMKAPASTDPNRTAVTMLTREGLPGGSASVAVLIAILEYCPKEALKEDSPGYVG